MSGSAARRVMRHRCTTQRNQAVADAHGAKVKPNWQNQLTSQPCFAFYTSGKREQIPGVVEAIEQLRILLPLGADVVETDRVGAIVDRLGRPLFAGPFTIEGPVARRADHLVLTLKETD